MNDNQLALFLAGDTALVIQQAKGIFTAMTEYDGGLDFRDAARKALIRIAQWERDCREVLELQLGSSFSPKR
jgi:hypothetical protein